MSDDIEKTRGTVSNYKDDRGGAAIIPSAVKGIVKDNIDKTRSGRIRVYLKRQESGKEDDPNNWTYVSYLSPFFGLTPNTASSKAEGDYVGNPHSYGFWATPPDLGTEVICIFLNGVPDDGYYIGCVPTPGLTHMTPGIASSDSIIANTTGESEGYGGATRLPVGEINNANTKQDNNSQLSKQPRPIHSYQAAILNQQGLIRDPDRGTISSSSVRESPSRVFGMSTPGRPIYEGGYDDKTIADAVKDDSVPDKNFRVVGRRGGHSLVMDDGDLNGKDQLVRIRSSMGHMIMMNDTIGSLFIIHANGQSYIEMGREGTIDMYSTNSVNIRTQGDLNLHADNDINLHAAKNFKINAENISLESSKETTSFVGTKFSQFVKSDYTSKINGKMSFESIGDASIKSSGISYINGKSKVNLNTGETGLVPQEVKQHTITAHTDTLYDSKKGYAAAPAKLSSITTRAPAHSPWASAGQGVNVKTDISADSNLPAAPSSALSSVNTSAGNPTTEVTSAGLSATVPSINSVSSTTGLAASKTLVSQMGVNAANGPLKDAVAKGAGIVDIAGTKVASLGQLGLNPTQLASSAVGIFKPGADSVINGMLAQGKSLEQAIPKNLFTGKDGVSSLSDLTKNISAQASAATSLLSNAESALKSTNIFSGNESPTQTGGLILGAATGGIDKAMAFVKGSAGDASGLGLKLGSSVSGLKLPTNLADAAGSMKSLVAGGNFAANLSDKTLGPLSGIPIGDQLKGLAAGAFAKVTGSFKSLPKPGIPINLTAIKAKNDEDKAKEDAEGENQTPEQKAGAASLNAKLTTAFGLGAGGSLKSSLEAMGASVKNATAGITDPAQAITAATNALTSATSAFKVDPSGLSGLPGGKLAGSLTNLGTAAKSFASDLVSGETGGGSVSSNLNNLSSLTSKVSGAINIPGLPSVPGIPNIPGAASITGPLSKISGALSGGGGELQSAIKGMQDKLGGGAKSLQLFASAGLGAGAIAKLNQAVSGLGGGAIDVKLPAIAEDSFDFGPMKKQAADLLGNPKIPALPFGTLSIPAIKMPTSAQAAEYDKIKAELTTQEDLQWTLRKTYLDLKEAKGPDDPKTQTAYAEWQTSTKKIEQLRQDMSKAVT